MHYLYLFRQIYTEKKDLLGKKNINRFEKVLLTNPNIFMNY
jgi:hypothetical protein